jgi:hypothetical protein
MSHGYNKLYVFIFFVLKFYVFLISILGRQIHAMPLRELLTYYMLTHPFNEKMSVETKNILGKHVR